MGKKKAAKEELSEYEKVEKVVSSYVTEDSFRRIRKAVEKNWKPSDSTSEQNRKTVMAILEHEGKKADKNIDAGEAPNSETWSKFAAEKWGYDYARNALLHYVVAKGLDKDCLAWMDAHFPDDRFNDED